MDLSNLNSYQTPITEELKKSLPKEVWSDLNEFIDTVPFIQWLIAPEEIRGFAKDRPRDSEGKIKIDIVKPHMLENMDFFRERALYFDKHGVYTDIRPNPNPKSDYAAFWKEEQRRWKEGLVRESDGEWIPGGYYFYLNYSPIWLNEEIKGKSDSSKKSGRRIRKFPKPWLGDYLWFHYMDLAKNNGHHCKLLKTRGIGAAGPNTEPILTPDGFKTYGHMKVGDSLIDLEGNPTTITDVFPQGKLDIYEVELMDGRKTRCTLNHNWSVYDKSRGKKNELITYTLEELINKKINWINGAGYKLYKFYLPDIAPVKYDEKELPIGPYALGALLGDGSMSTKTIKISSCDNDCEDFLPKFLESLGIGYYLGKYKNNAINYIIHDEIGTSYTMYHGGINPHGRNRLISSLEDLGLRVTTGNKFIPDIYKKASIEQRLELIKGLMDTDGSVSSDGFLEFSNSNERLLDDVAEVLRSLGIQCSKGLGRSPRKKKIMGVACNIKQEYRLFIRTNEILFKLPRKANRCRVKNIRTTTAIVSIKKLDYQEEATCFIVDNPKHIYLTKDFIPTHNSFKLGSLSPRNMYIEPGLPNFHLASDKTFLEGDKGVFGKVVDVLDHIADNTPLPKLRLIDRGLEKQLGYTDEYGVKKGLKSSVFGISLKDNPDKARGVRGPLIHYEEDGLFPNLEKAWGVNRKAVEDGDVVYGMMISLGTGGTEGSNFAGSEKLFYSPKAYNIQGIPNVFDKNSNGASDCGFFWGAYLNRAGCYDEEIGEPNVIKALIEVLNDRFLVKYNSSSPSAITQKKAEEPITPQEAIMRVDGTIFPVADLRDHLEAISPTYTQMQASHYIGDLILNARGEVEWKLNGNVHPITDFPLKDTPEGAIEIFEMPKKGSSNKIDGWRYIAGIDPYDDDTGTSLGSIMIMDLLTDRIVAEYTGRPRFAEDFFEICRRLLLLYNAKANYESNKKGIFSYFDRKSSLHLLCATPQILRDQELIKTVGYGNKSVGTNASKPINAWGRRLLRDWILSPAYTQDFDEDGEQIGEKLNLHTLKGKAFIEELIKWNPDANFDRVSSAGMLMIYRENQLKYIEQKTSGKQGRVVEDNYFANYDRKFGSVDFDNDYSYNAFNN